MTSNITIKKATSEDAEGIVRVRRETWLSTYPNAELGITKEDIESRLNLRTVDEDTERVSKQIAINTSLGTWVAKDNKIVIGYIVVIKGENESRIGQLYILQKYQNQGIGKKLMEKALDWLGNKKTIVFEVAFYKKFGFIENGVGKNDVGQLPSGKEIPEISMIKRF